MVALAFATVERVCRSGRYVASSISSRSTYPPEQPVKAFARAAVEREATVGPTA